MASITLTPDAAVGILEQHYQDHFNGEQVTRPPTEPPSVVVSVDLNADGTGNVIRAIEDTLEPLGFGNIGPGR